MVFEVLSSTELASGPSGQRRAHRRPVHGRRRRRRPAARAARRRPADRPARARRDPRHADLVAVRADLPDPADTPADGWMLEVAPPSDAMLDAATRALETVEAIHARIDQLEARVERCGNDERCRSPRRHALRPTNSSRRRRCHGERSRCASDPTGAKSTSDRSQASVKIRRMSCRTVRELVARIGVVLAFHVHLVEAAPAIGLDQSPDEPAADPVRQDRAAMAPGRSDRSCLRPGPCCGSRHGQHFQYDVITTHSQLFIRPACAERSSQVTDRRGHLLDQTRVAGVVSAILSDVWLTSCQISTVAQVDTKYVEVPSAFELPRSRADYSPHRDTIHSQDSVLRRSRHPTSQVRTVARGTPVHLDLLARQPRSRAEGIRDRLTVSKASESHRYRTYRSQTDGRVEAGSSGTRTQATPVSKTSRVAHCV